MADPDTTQLKSLLTSSQSLAFLLPQNPSLDAVATALALKLICDEVGKSTHVGCPDPMTVEFNRLVGVDSVSTHFGGRNLIISFPEQTEHVDKISYHIESGELRLVVSPKPDAPLIDHQKLKYIPASQADTIFLVGVDRLSDLGQIYENSRDLLQSHRQLVSLTTRPPAENYTPHQFYDPTATSLIEVTTYIIESLSLPFSADAATNLFIGLEGATQNFTHPAISAGTFETAARLMKSGARRQAPISAADFPAGSIPTSPGTAEAVAEFKDTPGPTTTAPADWYAPKIYRGPMLQ
ncbi:hypothetical protein A2634_00550 [Candidatus Amesbacteria bacterium RIFCSPHIGHO2_01_FULL_48_32]|uniref:DDH domain-containing protein n=1 Tax=Candidatus Amesbacteria bacterium RIFCSPLOWO2_01_FULL_48_25 TaxID=1797259 RepID=A0A1F4ZBI3_9BACT|nr:MAG: hypothetical protein A2634_00550 [Candidatus Amesbacteria bacterium RIFCSPHIGHO2_01_FULL_48_32]OGD03296.1 MAG: hypothetical protein A2989_00500 [Candidatus Amesbacteria bacterium RIFCSPLOWO2_01_FULL_48_25]HJZ05245.1 hypothetical protein [Patescibacteria group bacterium]